MSWRHLADDLQEAVLDTFAERDDLDAFTTEIDNGAGGGPVPIRAIFDDGALEVVLENEATASLREIRADVKIADLPSWPPTRDWRFRIRRPLEGDPLETAAVTVFEVWDHRPDGQGLVRLMLRKARPQAVP